MCGRIALGLDPDKICHLCQYKSSDNKHEHKITPDWKNLYNDRSYKPSYNMSPGMLCPVIILNKHLNDLLGSDEVDYTQTLTSRVVTPMLWGLVPSWYKGDIKQIQYKTINCKSETLDTKPAFRTAVKNGRRCVILAQGFYEWEKGVVKQPYFIYSDENKVKIEIKDEKYENLIKIAGIFDEWKEEKSGKIYFTFSIITVDSKDSPIEWIHDRMPLILETDDEVNEWLDYDNYPINKAKELFKPAKSILYHAVSRDVNNTYVDRVENIKQINLNTKIPSEEKNLTIKKKVQPSIDMFVKKCSIKSPSSPRSRSRSRSPVKRSSHD